MSNNNQMQKVADRPAASLLRSWGKRMAKGKVPVIPVYVGGNWILNIPRGNKRVLRLTVPGKKTS